MSRKSWFMVAMVVAVMTAVVVMTAGCSGPAQQGDALRGSDIFDPQRFGMAVYDVTDSGDSLAGGEFQVIAHPGEPEGDRLTSIALPGNDSTRADVMLSADRRQTVSVLITSIKGTDVRISGGQLAYNMTVLDDAWNALGDVYGFLQTANVSTPAGRYDGCRVYGADKKLYFGNASVDIRVRYYTHASSPVPVMYTVESPTGLRTYTLQSLYLPGDNDSTPRRVVQAFFDDLDSGRVNDAFGYLVTYDAVGRQFVPPDAATYEQFLANMNRTYGLGDESFRVQYVSAGTPAAAVTQAGYATPLVPWTSVHYQVGNMYAYRLEGGFYMVDLGGHWRIIV